MKKQIKGFKKKSTSIDNLPSKMTGYKYNLVNNRLKKYKNWRPNHHRVGDYTPYDIARRIIKEFIGKSYDEAFCKFCSLVPKYQQDVFNDCLDREMEFGKRRFNIDEEGNLYNVKDPNEYKGPYSITSDDYEFEWRHKITGELKPMYSYGVNNTDYEKITTKGEIKYFSSKTSPEYKRYFSERLKERNRRLKHKLKEQRNKNYSFSRVSEDN
jgi:hypothetical protein